MQDKARKEIPSCSGAGKRTGVLRGDRQKTHAHYGEHLFIYTVSDILSLVKTGGEIPLMRGGGRAAGRRDTHKVKYGTCAARLQNNTKNPPHFCAGDLSESKTVKTNHPSGDKETNLSLPP